LRQVVLKSADRQPVHVVYGGAQLYKAETPARLGTLALELLRNYAPDASAFSECLGLPRELATSVFERTVAKLEREPVEDFRIDFEDGYGYRSDAEEDGHAASTAQLLARGMGVPGFPPFIGIRIKPFTEALRARSARTLDLFLTALFQESSSLPDNFVVTLPKITDPKQVSELVKLLDEAEARYGLEARAIQIELMIETPQNIIDSSGSIGIPKLIESAQGRCRGLHFGPYDYSASCNIAAAEQRLDHPACDFARHVIQVSAADRGVFLSDGPSTILPIPRHRGPALTDDQKAENRAVVHRAMRHHFDLVQRSLAHGYYQGWDLHPGQIPTRYAAVYAFFLKSQDAAATRLRNFVDKAAQATLVGDVFDDAATGQGLLNFLLRGVNCGAFTEAEAAASGLTIDELRGRSFLKIMESRRKP
jgi:HpcH/HpaI aldolase/citrate lyase family